MRNQLLFSGALGAFLSLAGNAAAWEHSTWSAPNALTLKPDAVEGALFGHWTLGLTERVELRGHPLLSILVPDVEARVQVWNNGFAYLSTRTELLSPTPALRLMAKEGAFGLLPASSKVDWSLLLENAFLLSLKLNPNQWLTLQSGGTLCIARQPKLPLLDFPFFYQRFAALNTGGTLFASLAANGNLVSDDFGYSLVSTLWLLPLAEGPKYVSESKLLLSWFINDSHRIELGAHFALHEFPVGWRWYALPSIDYGWHW